MGGLDEARANHKKAKVAYTKARVAYVEAQVALEEASNNYWVALDEEREAMVEARKKGELCHQWWM